jgi:signal transduction histidine kinase
VRNPLAGLRGSLQILATRLPADMREREIVGAMVERIDMLAERVRDILLFAGSRDARLQPVSLAPILHDAATGAAASVPGAPAPEVSGPDSVVVADPEMLRALLLNLLMNACQASRHVSPEPVRVQVTASDRSCRIDVLDRGPGIDPAVRDRIFEPFFTTKHGGTGLGLAIVKRLADLQDADVTLADRDGGGARATLTLPLHRS